MTLDRARLAVAVVGMYPAAWRERYAAEMLALLEDGGAQWRDLLDLMWACCGEWQVSLADAEAHPVAAGLIVTGAPMVTATALAWAFDATARQLVVPILDRTFGAPDIRMTGVFVAGVPLLLLGRFFVVTTPLAWWSTRSTRWTFSRAETFFWMASLFGGVVCLAWNGAPRFDDVMLTFTLGAPLLSYTGDRLQRTLAYQMLKTARKELKVAERELTRERSRPLELTNGRARRRVQADVDRLNEEIKVARTRMRGPA